MNDLSQYKISPSPNLLIEEDLLKYNELDFPLKNETFRILGACMEVHNELGVGFQEVVYKDALEIEFKMKKILFEREKSFKIIYKEITLDRYYVVDFFVFGNVILELKADRSELKNHSPQVLNYLASSKCRIALLVNFGFDRLQYKRFIL